LSLLRKKRLKQWISLFSVVVFLGVLYLFSVHFTTFRIPCPFYLLTGLYCPGCGISRMCIALFHLDFVSAFQNNALVMLFLLPGGAMFLRSSIRYVREGKIVYSIPEKVLLIVGLALTVLFWIFRNLEAFSYLAPLSDYWA